MCVTVSHARPLQAGGGGFNRSAHSAGLCEGRVFPYYVDGLCGNIFDRRSKDSCVWATIVENRFGIRCGFLKRLHMFAAIAAFRPFP